MRCIVVCRAHRIVRVGWTFVCIHRKQPIIMSWNLASFDQFHMRIIQAPHAVWISALIWVFFSCCTFLWMSHSQRMRMIFFCFLNDSPLCCECLGCFISLHAIHFGDRSLFFLWFCPSFVNNMRDSNTFCAGSFLSVVHFSFAFAHTWTHLLIHRARKETGPDSSLVAFIFCKSKRRRHKATKQYSRVLFNFSTDHVSFCHKTPNLFCRLCFLFYKQTLIIILWQFNIERTSAQRAHHFSLLFHFKK